ncbi:unnamed protein product [Oncorhynchus mykiss]|uniref:Uncharacterized protein n=1 Tax=Oncorhynchus mykiss TaxID=8022 RepID=A0A060X3U0_ONCMY|nr:unnamed protein product [Oncorhynchus mykiss]
MPVTVEPSPMKHSRDPSFSSGLHRSRDRPQGKRSTQRTGSSRAKLKMAELLAIKRELTLIKVQIDGLLDSVDKMDRQRKDHSDSPPTQEGSVSDSVSSLEDSPVSLPHRQRESPEPGEASDDDQHLQHYQRQCRVNNTSFCLPLLETQHTCTTSNYFCVGCLSKFSESQYLSILAVTVGCHSYLKVGVCH